MTSKRITTNRTAFFFIALLVIIVAFLLLGGVPWIKGMTHEGRSITVANLNWAQILISLVIGFVLGLLVGRRKW
jgi:hypothetical protein